MSIQEATHRLIVLERKILRINMAMNGYLMCRGGDQLDGNMVKAGGGLAHTVSFVLMLTVTLLFVAMAIHDLYK